MMRHTLAAVWSNLGHTLPLFSLTAAIITLVSASLITLEWLYPKRRWIEIVVGVHMLPLLMVPALVALELSGSFEENFTATARGSLLALGFFGYLFHTFVAYLLLKRVLNWENTLETLRLLGVNLQNFDLPTRLAIHFLLLAPPLSSLFVVLVVFQESMLSAPFFLTKHTALYLMVRDNPNLMHSAPVLLIGSVAILVVLSVSYAVPKRLGAVLAMLAIHNRMRRFSNRIGQGHSNRGLWPWTLKLVASLSAFVNLACIVIVVLRVLVRVGLRNFSALWTVSWRGAAASLSDSAMICGIFAASITLCLFFYIGAMLLAERGISCAALNSVPLIPPAITGTIGLLFVFNRTSQESIGYLLLVFYGTLLTLFLLRDPKLRRQYVLIGNIRSSRTSMLWPLLASPLGGTLVPIVFAIYFLWIEDSIQVNILNDSHSITNHILGMKASAPPASDYLIILLSFLAWLVLALLAVTVNRGRFAWVEYILQHNRRSAARVISVFLLFVTVVLDSRASVQNTDSHGSRNKDCNYQEKILHGDIPWRVSQSGCPAVNVGKLIIEGPTIPHVLLPSAIRLKITEIVFTQRNSGLEFEGDAGSAAAEVQIGSITTPDSGTETPEIQFANIKLQTLVVDGDDSSDETLRPTHHQRISLVMQDSAAASHIELSDFYGKTIDLRLLRTSQVNPARVYMHGINTMELHIHGDLTGKAHEGNVPAAVSINAELERPASTEAARVLMDGLSLQKGYVMIAPSSDGTTSPPCRVSIQLNNLDLSADTSPISFQSDKCQADISLQSIRVKGKVDLQARTIRHLILSDIAPGSPGDSQIEIKGGGFQEMRFNQISIRELSISSDDNLSASLLTLRARDVDVEGTLSVPKDFVQFMGRADMNPIYRNRLFRLLQERGVYTESGKPVDLDALYLRKRGDLESISRLTAWIVDWLTGFGIKLYRPLCSFLLILAVQFSLRLWFYRTEPLWKSRLKQTARGRFDGTDPKGLHFSSSLFDLTYFVQVTMLSIYLSQTTLQ